MFERIKELVQSWIPVQKVTVYNTLSEPGFKADRLDVDSLHDALRQAEGGDVRQLFAIYRDYVISDPHVQSEFSKRKLAIIGDVHSILADDKKNANDVAARDRIELMIKRTKGWLLALGHMQDSVLWPVSVTEKVFTPTASGYALKELVSVPHELLDFRTGTLRIRRVDADGRPNNESDLPDPRRYIIHRSHLLTTPDNWGGPMRSILFWVLLGSMDRDWWARFLDRYGSPFLVGKYDQGDDQSRTTLERAFSAAVRIGGLVVSKETSVELQQAAQGNAGDAYEKFYTISRREISKLIVGQTLSGEAQSTGLGSGVAKFHSDVRDDYRKFDAAMLGETLKHGLFAQFLQINGLPGEVPGITWGSTSTEESEVTGALLSSLAQAGLRVADSGLEAISEKVGFQIERMPAAPAAALPGNLTGFSVVPMTRLERADAAVDDIARAGAADLAQAFRGSLAPVRQMILDSTSAEDLQKRILQGYSTWESGKVSEILEQALVAFSANGVAR